MSDYIPPRDVNQIVPIDQADMSRPPPPAGQHAFHRSGGPVYVIVNSGQTNNNQSMPCEQNNHQRSWPGLQQCHPGQSFNHQAQHGCNFNSAWPAEPPSQVGRDYNNVNFPSHGDGLRAPGVPLQRADVADDLQGLDMSAALQFHPGQGYQGQMMLQSAMPYHMVEAPRGHFVSPALQFHPAQDPQRQKMLQLAMPFNAALAPQGHMMSAIQFQAGQGHSTHDNLMRGQVMLPASCSTNSSLPLGRTRVVELPSPDEDEDHAVQQPVLAIGWKDEEPSLLRRSKRQMEVRDRHKPASVNGDRLKPASVNGSRSSRKVASNKSDSELNEQVNVQENASRPGPSRVTRANAPGGADRGASLNIDSEEDEDSDVPVKAGRAGPSRVAPASGLRSTRKASSKSTESQLNEENDVQGNASRPGPSRPARANGSRGSGKVTSKKNDSEGEDSVQDSAVPGPSTSRENDSSDSGESIRDGLGRWMDEDDDLSSEFERSNKKISKGNQRKKQAALKVSKRCQPLSDSDEDFEAEARKKPPCRQTKKKSLSLAKSSKATGKAEPKFSGALPESEASSVDDPEVIVLSHTDTDEEARLGRASAAEMSRQGERRVGNKFQIPPNSLPEDYCTICFIDYEDATQDGDAQSKTACVGIFKDCHCHRFCLHLCNGLV